MTRRSARLCAPLAAVLFAVTAAPAAAAAPFGPERPAPAGELLLKLKKLNVLGSVLYVAAHPDDENTAMIAAFAEGRLTRTAYLSVTRGDGGQNLIGSELGPALGLVRTHELLAARRIDGGEQMFTRAIDFGYSKTADETFRIWGREEVLRDVVRAIRTFRPDVVIARFPETGDGGHGHHTASAVLAREAFRAAGDATRFPEQIVEGLAPWKPRRLFWNGWRRDGKPIEGSIPYEIGDYSPALGRSHTETAAESRSQHKSQGFGSSERRGRLANALVLLEGDAVSADPFEGIGTSWARVPGGARVGRLLAEAEGLFDARDPSRVLPKLLEAHAAMRGLGADPWVDVKRRELLAAIRSASGLWLEAIAASPSATPGSAFRLNVTALVRAGAPATLARVVVPWGTGEGLPAGAALKLNEPVSGSASVPVPADAEATQPHWLRARPSRGLYAVPEPKDAIRPDGASLRVSFEVVMAGETLRFEEPVYFRRTDPVKGEEVRPFVVEPPVSVELEEEVLVLPDHGPRVVKVTVRAAELPRDRSGPPPLTPSIVASTGGADAKSGAEPPAKIEGSVRLTAPPSWRIEPAARPFALEPGTSATLEFSIRPPESPGVARLVAEAATGGRAWSLAKRELSYPHLPPLVWFPPAEARVVHVDLAGPGGRVGYVSGPGDEVPGVLGQMGFAVTSLSADDLLRGDLSRFDAVVLGIRAANTRPELKEALPRLHAWVETGGTLVLQYNTSFELVTDALGPFPLKLGRERVTTEEAPVTLLAPEHALLTTPNRIGPADFDGWVQERGLYFPATWDERYVPLLGMADPGEKESRGSLLVARHGKGTYVYTGLSFFRQLPAGVPGAIRLFANLVSGGTPRG
ncbi:MAG: PIG-L family deacetylase [Thermoanaerobaculia bacterium]